MTMSAVGVLQCPGTMSLLPPTVSCEQFGSAFFGTKVCADVSVCDVPASVHWNFVKCDEHDGVGAFADAGNALGQAAKFSGI